jgi:hypothetical protein
VSAAMRRAAVGASLGLVLLLAAPSRPARAQVADDPLGPFLRGLADSTDATFGRKAAEFDTTGVDSLIRAKAAGKPDSTKAAKRGVSFSASPVSDFHRASGVVMGASIPVTIGSGTTLTMEGSYGFANEEGRYRIELARELWRSSRTRAGAEPATLEIDVSYARETVRFAAEHETRFPSSVGAFFTGRDRQSVYERRGTAVALKWAGIGRFAMVGWRGMRDQSMPRATNFTVWGRDSSVPDVTPADGGSYDEGFARLATTRSGRPYMGVDGQYASRSRWRARLGAAQAVVLGPMEAHLQVEGGMAAFDSPRQNALELGGALAVPSLGFGDEAGNRLLLGKLELVHGLDLIRAMHLSSLAFMSLRPAIFAQGGSAWVARDGSWEAPPDAAWRGAAGIALIHLPGFPTSTTHVRLQMAWPVGYDSGCARFSMSIGEWFDVVPRK